MDPLIKSQLLYRLSYKGKDSRRRKSLLWNSASKVISRAQKCKGGLGKKLDDDGGLMVPVLTISPAFCGFFETTAHAILDYTREAEQFHSRVVSKQ